MPISSFSVLLIKVTNYAPQFSLLCPNCGQNLSTVRYNIVLLLLGVSNHCHPSPRQSCNSCSSWDTKLLHMLCGSIFNFSWTPLTG